MTQHSESNRNASGMSFLKKNIKDRIHKISPWCYGADPELSVFRSVHRIPEELDRLCISLWRKLSWSGRVM